MTKYVLHGGYTRHDNELNRSFLREITKGLSDGSKVLLVMFAVEDEKLGEKYNLVCDFVSRAVSETRLEYVLATEEELEIQIRDAELIYIQGGSTEKLLEALRKHSDFKNWVKGKVVAGSSAGAYAISTYHCWNTEDGVQEGLGLLPVKVLCHYESEQLPHSPLCPERLEKTAPELELVFLKDYEWKVFEVDD